MSTEPLARSVIRPALDAPTPLPRCTHCDYIVVGLPDNLCPECGNAIDWSHAYDDAAIEIEDHAGSSCDLATIWRGIFTKMNSARWQMPEGILVLTGVNGTSRFIARNAAGTRIAIGDVRLNGGCNLSARAINPDDLSTPAQGVFARATP